MYAHIRETGFLLLPTDILLRCYKNSVNRHPGINPEMIRWMYQEAIRSNIPSDGFRGGIILDECSIQEDIQLEYMSDGARIIGLVEAWCVNLLKRK